jgi:hypothetical protein
MLTVTVMVASLAVGQTSAFGTVTTTVGGQQTAILPNPLDCNSVITGTWQAALTGTPCSSMQLWITTFPDCESVPEGVDFVLPSVPLANFVGGNDGGTVQFSVTQMFSAGGDAGTFSCGAAGVQATFLVCASISMDLSALCTTKQTVQTSVSDHTAAQIIYDTKPPGAPALTAVDPRDGTLAVSFTVSPDTDPNADFVTFNIGPHGSPSTSFVNAATVSAGTTVAILTGLTNGTTYDVRAFAEDPAGNISSFSNILEGTPEPPFTDAGVDGGTGSGTGHGCGCAADPGALCAALAIAGAIRRRRR